MTQVQLPLGVVVLGVELQCIDVEAATDAAPFPETVFSQQRLIGIQACIGGTAMLEFIITETDRMLALDTEMTVDAANLVVYIHTQIIIEIQVDTQQVGRGNVDLGFVVDHQIATQSYIESGVFPEGGKLFFSNTRRTV